MKLTKREKILLYFLLCFILVIGGLFVLVLPTMQAKNEAELAYESANRELENLKNTIIEYGDLDAAIQDTQNKINEVKGKFYQPMVNEDIDKLLKDKMLTYSLTPLSMSISDPVEVVLNMYQEQAETSSATNTGEDSDGTEQADTATLGLVSVSITFGGDTVNLGNLVDDIRAMEATQVGSLSYDASSADTPMSISFKLYIIK